MAIYSSDQPRRDELKMIWRKPNDIRELEKIWPVTKRQFSLQLLRMRLNKMDKETQHRAIKVMDALKTGLPCRL